MINTPHVDWFLLSPELSLLGAGAVCLMVAVLAPDAALDLRPAELAIVVPLVACLLALSVWPAAVSEHSFPAPEIHIQFRVANQLPPVTYQPPAIFRPPATPATPHGTMLNEGPTSTVPAP